MNSSIWNSLCFLPAGETGCFILMSHREGLTHYRRRFMVYCSQITDLLIVMPTYSHLFSSFCFEREKDQRGQVGENFISSKLSSHIKTDRPLKFKNTFHSSNLVKIKPDLQQRGDAYKFWLEIWHSITNYRLYTNFWKFQKNT